MNDDERPKLEKADWSLVWALIWGILALGLGISVIINALSGDYGRHVVAIVGLYCIAQSMIFVISYSKSTKKCDVSEK